jgi:hypothetical protein
MSAVKQGILDGGVSLDQEVPGEPPLQGRFPEAIPARGLSIVSHPPSEDLEATLVRGIGQLVSREGERYAIKTELGEVLWGQKALSCWLVPQLGDWVEYVTHYPDLYIVSVLSSLAREIRLSVPDELLLEAPVIRLEAKTRLDIRAPELSCHVSGGVTFRANQWSEHVETVAYHTAELSVHHATQIGLSAEKILMN